MSRKSNAVSVIAITFGLLLSTHAKACSPATLTPQQVYDYADKIVVVRAISSDWTSEKRENVFNAIAHFIRPFLPPDDAKRQGKTVFKIDRVIKGEAAAYITIRHHVDDAACGVTFNALDNYLIFVRERKGKYFTNIFGVEPFLMPAGYKELAKLVGVTEDDRLKLYQDYLAPVEGNQSADQDQQ